MSRKRSKREAETPPKGKRKASNGKRKAPPEKPSIAEQEARCEAAILRDVIEFHPTHLAEDELIRRQGVDPEDAEFARVDMWRAAIGGLRGDGLLQPGEPVTPTIAALRFAELVDL